MLAASGYKTKKALKDSVGKKLLYSETSLIAPEYTPNGKVTLVGPSAYQRNWFATVTLKDGIITKVQ